MLGVVIALFSAVGFALANIYLRRGMVRTGESYSALLISLLLGTVLFAIWVVLSGTPVDLSTISWLGVGAAGLAGVVHFLIGRFFSYTAIRLIGANRTIPIQTSYILIAAVMGVILFGERVTPLLVFALVMVVGGIVLIARTGPAGEAGQSITRATLTKGILAALATALCWGISPILVKYGLKELASPALTTFISGLVALLVVALTTVNQSNIRHMRGLDRTASTIFIVAALFTTLAQIARYWSLDLAPVAVVTPVTGTMALFIYPLSFLINRKMEAFDRRTIIGGLIAIAGIFCIFFNS